MVAENENDVTLLPCPFCGSEAKMRGGIMDGYWVGCFGKCFACTQHYMTEAEAIEAWNTRASETQLLAEMQTRVWIAERQRNEAMAALMDEGITVPLERTCHIECYDDGVDEGLDGEWYSYDRPKYDLSCGHSCYETEPPKYCPNCGAKVVDA